jgi:hypothetical protein
MARLTLLVEETRLVDRSGCNRCIINWSLLVARGLQLASLPQQAEFLENSNVKRKRNYSQHRLKLFLKNHILFVNTLG